MIPVNKPSLPKRKHVDRYLDGIYERAWLTNEGPLVRELTGRLEDYLGVSKLLLVANGTVALQVAYRALGIDRGAGDSAPEAVTTPFTYIATKSSLEWEGLRPRFADVAPATLNLDPAQAAARLGEQTRLVVPVHVYGSPCDVQAFDAIAARAGVPIVYDAAHAFGVKVDGASVLRYGDASTLSFHATKVFHTVEGGAIVFRDADALERAKEMITFGMRLGVGRVNRVGINAKLSEVHAAFGLALLDEIDALLERRREIYASYVEQLPDSLDYPAGRPDTVQNAAYMPVLFDSLAARDRCAGALENENIGCRRYFSLCSGNEVDRREIPVASDAADRVLCLPMHTDLTDRDIRRIAAVVADAVR